MNKSCVDFVITVNAKAKTFSLFHSCVCFVNNSGLHLKGTSLPHRTTFSVLKQLQVTLETILVCTSCWSEIESVFHGIFHWCNSRNMTKAFSCELLLALKPHWFGWCTLYTGWKNRNFSRLYIKQCFINMLQYFTFL